MDPACEQEMFAMGWPTFICWWMITMLRFKSHTLAFLNWLLTTQCFLPWKSPTRRMSCATKYAVLTLADFCKGTKGWFHSYIWGRFSQQSGLVYAQDKSIAHQVQLAMAQAVTTFINENSSPDGSRVFCTWFMDSGTFAQLQGRTADGTAWWLSTTVWRQSGLLWGDQPIVGNTQPRPYNRKKKSVKTLTVTKQQSLWAFAVWTDWTGDWGHFRARSSPHYV